MKLFEDRVVGRKTALAVAVRTEGVCHRFSLPLSSRRTKVSAQAADPKEGSGWEKRSQEGPGLPLTGSVTCVIHDA